MSSFNVLTRGRHSVHDAHGHANHSYSHLAVGDRVDLPAKNHFNCGVVR